MFCVFYSKQDLRPSSLKVQGATNSKEKEEAYKFRRKGGQQIQKKEKGPTNSKEKKGQFKRKKDQQILKKKKSPTLSKEKEKTCKFKRKRSQQIQKKKGSTDSIERGANKF